MENSSLLRFRVLQDVLSRTPRVVDPPAPKTSAYFGMNVFDRNKMQQYLTQETYNALVEAIDGGNRIDRRIAEHVASGMKSWAMELGATHYTHWFHPLTEGTAEKHDAFIDPTSAGQVMETLSGKLLVQQEPDASSFPSGGIRNTFEARGYSAWDPSSPAFVLDKTLCIPTIFISYTGESLDYKAPLLRAIAAADKAAVDVCRLFDKDVNKVISYLGWEQEYFLVDYSLHSIRTDLVMTGRTLVGQESAKNQQLEDHYFGAIPTRVTAYMRELEYEAYKLGIPLKTRHNEVAPNQFELAPVYEEMNLAIDHNLVLMSLMKKVARRHHFKVLLHEKPFYGVNGSGKHCNWSLGTDTGVNLMSPGKNPKSNLQFLTFLVNALMAVHKNNGLLKASIASAGNAHRLGANEAPPAIISVFLGTHLKQVLDYLEENVPDSRMTPNEKTAIKLDIGRIPEILLDNTDRNRTSPFAFTGNRFEFRAVGSSANCASAMIALSAAMADQLTTFSADVQQLIDSGLKKDDAIFQVLRNYITLSKPIRFDGNGYSDEWKAEAARRGLDCEARVPYMYDAYLTSESIAMFSRTGIFTEKELHARNEVKWEIYTKKIQIEARVLGDMVLNQILPATIRFQNTLIENVKGLQSILEGDELNEAISENMYLIREISKHMVALRTQIRIMVDARKSANKTEDGREKAVIYEKMVYPMFDDIRRHVNKLERLVDNQVWPLAKYSELFFSR